MKKRKRTSGLADALLETAADMERVGLLDKSALDKITLRHLDEKAMVVAKPISGTQIRKMRMSARMSQAVFARYLNLTVGYVSQLERGTKAPTGAALALLNVIKRKGIEAVL
jgi:putative transcriptional regulator